MRLKGRKVLVTGAGGFIGSHVAELLVRRGARVRAFLRYDSRCGYGCLEFAGRKEMEKIEVFRGDIRDPSCARESAQGVDVIFHLAAHVSIPYSYDSPWDVAATNVTGTLNLLEAARINRVRKFIHASTSEVYGTAEYVPIDEKHPLRAQSPYSATKIAADKLVESYWRSYGLPAVTVRPFNSFGPRQSQRAVLPAIIFQALYSMRVELGSLEPTRDMTYVSDTARAFIRAAECDDCVGETINVGSGVERSVREMVEIAGKVIGRKIRVVRRQARIRPEESEVMRLCADSRKAREMLGWKPEVPFEEGVRRTVEWARKNEALFRKGCVK